MSAEKAIGLVLLGVGAASLGVLLWASQRLMLLERAIDAGDVVVLGVFALFGAFCAALGWRLLRTPASVVPHGQAATQGPAKRITLSRACAAGGVLLLMLSVLLPAQWYPVPALFAGLALLAVSHALTPCVERLEQLRRARESVRQL